MLWQIKQNLEADWEDMASVGFSSLQKMCFKHCGMIALRQKKNQKFAVEFVAECQAQLTKFDFLLRLDMSQKIFSHTDNLSKTSQRATLSASSGQLTLY